MKKLTAIVCAAALCVAASAEEQIEITPIEARTTIRGPGAGVHRGGDRGGVVRGNGQ